MFQHWYVLLILAAIALIIFGPSRLPELGASLGKAIREFRNSTSDLGDVIKEETHKPTASTPTAVGTTYAATPESPTEPAAPAAPAAPAPPPESPKA
jgi:TatA/E family protein of Tat protein translocase